MKIYKLPKDFAEKLTTSLRSGTYKQTSGRLKKEDGYCCLGVASLICGISEDKLNRAYPSEGWLPKETLENIIFEDVHYLTLEAVLAKMNDEGKTFDQIADWINENVEFI